MRHTGLSLKVIPQNVQTKTRVQGRKQNNTTFTEYLPIIYKTYKQKPAVLVNMRFWCRVWQAHILDVIHHESLNVLVLLLPATLAQRSQEYEVMRHKNATSRNLQCHSGILLVVFCVELLYHRVCCVGDFEPLFEEGIGDI